MRLLSPIKAVLFTASLTLFACDQDTSYQQGPEYGNVSGDTSTDFDQLALVTHLTDNVISPTFAEFVSQSQLQTSAVENYCDAEQALTDLIGDSAAVNTNKALAQQKWRDTMDVWQQAEVMQLGPLLLQDGLLRDNIYSWPIAKPCSVDYDVIYFKNDLVNGQAYDITKRTSSRKGLVALEYLLFNSEPSSSCDAGNEPEGWNSLTTNEIVLARCKFAVEVANDIESNAQLLNQQWLAEDGYASQLKQAGLSGSNFEIAHDAVNRITDAMQYLEKQTKSQKLAKTIGEEGFTCDSGACPEYVESPFSQHSLMNIINNLIAFEKLFTGENGVGFDDYLYDVATADNNADATANEMSNDITTALSNLNAMNETLTEALENNPASVEQRYEEIQKVTTNLKNDFITSLELTLPATSAGDND